MGLLTFTKKLQLLVFAVNGLFIFFGTSLIATGVYIVINHGDFSEIVGSIIYSAGTYCLILVGALAIMVAFLGFCGANKLNRCLIITYIALTFLLLLVAFVGSILVLAFHGSMDDAAKTAMVHTLKTSYGQSALITRAWDTCQSMLRCCGVDDRQWDVYIDSYWDRWINADENDRSRKIPITSPYYKLVPESCCWTLVDTRTGWPTSTFRNKGRCQHWQYGPPLFKTGPHNDAIYYRGCFNTARDYMSFHASYIGGVGFGLVILMIISIIASCFLLCRKRPKKEAEALKYER